ncbi:hypothetical protein V5O48_000527 [Marasmius crinis-equi]|uniref:Alginate lyase domain-containing protein n=1 Tax=Marasmius crinis-equi TaxID=585013 RepID=A0ABR3G1G8_9AGAR
MFDGATHLVVLVLLTLPCLQVQAATSYISEFVDPNFIAAKQFDVHTTRAGSNIERWATAFSERGPWSVTNSTVAPPSKDRHDYMSWMSHAWPNCTAMSNVTLTEENKWNICPYVIRNELNPDTVKVNNASVNSFRDLADAVLYNSIASVVSKVNSDVYSKRVVSHLQTWFLDPEKRMNPNLNFAQMKRGPKGQVGHYGGVMQLRGFVKIASGILILRASKNPNYTPAIDQGMTEWCKQYIQWLGTSIQGVREGLQINYHATFFHAQLAALKLIVDDRKGALETIDAFFNTKFMNQIDSSGDQVDHLEIKLVRSLICSGKPLARLNTTQPQLRRTQNIAGLITLVRLAKFADPSSNYWNKTTSQGGSIKSALDFAMSQVTPTNSTGQPGNEVIALEPLIAAVASTFGDPDKKYQTFLLQADPQFARNPYFFWNQPLSGGPDEDRDKTKMTGRPRANGSGRNYRNVMADTFLVVAGSAALVAGLLLGL